MVFPNCNSQINKSFRDLEFYFFFRFTIEVLNLPVQYLFCSNSYSLGIMADIEFRQIRYFVIVAEELNFTRAAERLQIAQPPLSRQIQSLETALGVELIDRSRRRVRLTPAGNVFLEQSRQLLRQLEIAIRAAQRVDRGEIGRLVVGFEGSGHSSRVLQVVQAFRSQFPDVEFVLQEMTSKQQVEALGDRLIDLGFIEPAMATDKVAIETLLTEPLMAVLAAHHPLAQQEHLALSQLATEPWITGRSNIGCGLLSRITAACAEADFTLDVRQETNDIQMMLGFVAAGLGVTLLPASVSRDSSPEVAYRPLKPPTPTVGLAIAWNPAENTAPLSAFLQTVKAISADAWDKYQRASEADAQ
jgi:DNA-binding transcriptional LysR family regulator